MKYIALICGLFFSHILFSKSSLIPVQLRIEYLDNPVGLDVEKPRFSWILNSKKKNQFAESQTAYRVLVASSEKKIADNSGDFWDSGWVESSEMGQVQYQGKPLKSDEKYYWKIAVKDQDGKTSDWSEAATWSTGILNSQEWKAKWIGGTETFDSTLVDNNVWDPWLRKSFELAKKANKAYIYVASIGYHELYVNGLRVGEEVMAPVVTDHTKRARYVAYDIAPYLVKGKNVIGIWLGTSWSIFPAYDIDGSRPLLPLVSAQMKVYGDSNGRNERQILYDLHTDDSWKVKKSPNKLLGVWDFARMGGELWDDNKREDLWNSVNYNDSDWDNVNEYPISLKISAQNAVGNKAKEVINPVKIDELPDGSYRVDMGVNFAGWTNVKVRGNVGDTIEFFYSEREKDLMTFNLHSAFIIGHSGEGEFKNRFNYSSGRWITIKGLREKPKLSDIKGWMVRTDFKNASSFESSDELQNWLHDRIKWTFENLSLGGFIVDCPQRERMGYGGDAHATSETGMLNYQLGGFYSKWMEDWRDVQGTEPMVGNMRDQNYARKAVTSGRILNNGILPHTAPTYWGGGGPAWGGIVVSLPYFMYQHYGDKQALEENFELIERWLDFLDSNTENGIMKRFGGQWDFLGDWLWPNATAEGMNNDKPETLCLNNIYRVYNLRTAAKIAEILGKKEHKKKWLAKADISTKAINSIFYDKNKANYADGSMANMAAALLADVVPMSEKIRVEASLEKEIMENRKGHIHAGITGGALLFKWLREAGRNDLIYSMTSKTTYPSWGYMRENDATTIWEMWEKELPGHSLLHSSYLYPGAWAMDGLVGIKVDKPGYNQFIIQPPLKEHTTLNWVKGSFKSPMGLIKSEWNRDPEGDLKLHVVVPINTTAILKVSKEEKMDISHYQDQIKRLSDEGPFKRYRLPSGIYNF